MTLEQQAAKERICWTSWKLKTKAFVIPVTPSKKLK
jgi:hypothetical protein